MQKYYTNQELQNYINRINDVVNQWDMHYRMEVKGAYRRVYIYCQNGDTEEAISKNTQSEKAVSALNAHLSNILLDIPRTFVFTDILGNVYITVQNSEFDAWIWLRNKVDLTDQDLYDLVFEVTEVTFGNGVYS